MSCQFQSHALAFAPHITRDIRPAAEQSLSIQIPAGADLITSTLNDFIHQFVQNYTAPRSVADML
jgi:hypothetical protein